MSGLDEKLSTILGGDDCRIGPEASLHVALERLQQGEKGAVVIAAGHEPLAILTERDLIRLIARRVDLNESALGYASCTLVTTHSDRSLEYAMHQMVDHSIRHLVVVEESGRFLDLVTQDQLLQFLEGDLFLTRLRALHLMGARQNYFTLAPDASISEVLDLMHQKQISMVPVEADRKPVGIVTEFDLLRIALRGEDLTQPVSAVMRSPVETVSIDCPVEELVMRMRARRIRHMVVVDADGSPVGTVTNRDLLRNVAGNYSGFLELKLKQSRDALDTLPQLIIEVQLYDGVYLIRWVNRRTRDFFGEGLIDRPVTDLLPSREMEQLFVDLDKSGRVDGRQFDFVDRYFELTAVLTGAFVQIILTDTTVRVRRENELRWERDRNVVYLRRLESANLYIQSLLDALPNLVCVYSERGISGANRALLDFLGYESLELLLAERNCLRDTFLPMEGYLSARTGPHWYRDVIKQQNEKLETKAAMRDRRSGEMRSFLVNVEILSTVKAESEVEYIISFTDVTAIESYRLLLQQTNQQLEERVRERTTMLEEANRQLSESRQLLSEAHRIAGLGHFEWNVAKNTIRLSGDIWGLVPGSSEMHAFDMPYFTSFIPGPDLHTIRRSLVLAIHGSSEVVFRHNFRRPDGRVSTMQVHGRIYGDHRRRFVRMVGVVRDITDQLRLETEKREREMMLVQQSRMAAMGEMIGAIAHQWRQPLNVIALIAQDLEDLQNFGELTSVSLQSGVQRVLDQVEFMSATIDDFRRFFRPSRVIEPFLVAEAIRDVFRMAEYQMRNRDIDFILNGNEELRAYGYLNEFKHIIHNLLNNSRDAIEQCRKLNHSFRGVIELTLRSENELITLFCKDNGGGFPEMVLQNQFQPYFTTKGDQGTGIGLYLTRMLLHRMQGEIRIENCGDGACVTLRLQATSIPGSTPQS